MSRLKILIISMLIILFIPVFCLAQVISGQRYSVQVKAESTFSQASAYMGQYRKFAKPFVFSVRVSDRTCNKDGSCVTNQKTMYRLLIGIYKSKAEAQDNLAKFSKENPALFKGSFIQGVVE